MAVWQVPKKEKTRDGRCWVFEARFNGVRFKSKKYHTKKEALEAERQYIFDREKYGDQSKMILKDLMDDHYNHQKSRVKATTYTNYKNKMSYLKSIQNIRLDKLNIRDIEIWKEEMNNRNLATKTKNDALKYLKSVLNYGTKEHDFNFRSLYNKIDNFTNKNEIPKEMQFYTYEEFKQYISVEDDLKYRTLFKTLYFCGLRMGELRGLRFENIDLNSKEIRVITNVVNEKGPNGFWLETSPKTRDSKRKVPISDKLYYDLVDYIEECKKIIDFNEKMFVFGGLAPIHPYSIRLRNYRNAEKAGLKRIRIHDFRHSAASLLINNGANPVSVARFLGHTKIDETLNTYSHMFKSGLDDIVDTINKLN